MRYDDILRRIDRVRDEWVTIQVAAGFIGCNRGTVRNWINEGQLSDVRIDELRRPILLHRGDLRRFIVERYSHMAKPRRATEVVTRAQIIERFATLEEEWVTVSRTAQLFNTHTTTIRKWLDENPLWRDITIDRVRRPIVLSVADMRRKLRDDPRFGTLNDYGTDPDTSSETPSN